MKPYQQGEIRYIVKLRMAGWHPHEIAEIVERTRCAIHRLLSIEKKRNSLSYPKIEHKNTRWTRERIEAMAREYPKKRYQQLAKENGISTPRVFHLLAKRAHGLQDGTWRI